MGFASFSCPFPQTPPRTLPRNHAILFSMPASSHSLSRQAGFLTTQWSVVLRAGRGADTTAHPALAQLCERYWLPLYAYVRRHKTDRQEAQDLTQEFFARLLEKKTVARANPERGRFRAFLLASLKHFLANEWNRARTQKRGGQSKQISFDWNRGESRLKLEPAQTLTPERLFEREWALQLLELVFEKLRAQYAAAGKSRQFEALHGFLRGERSDEGYAAAARELKQTEGAVRQEAHRLRKAYRALLKDERSQTLA